MKHEPTSDIVVLDGISKRFGETVALDKCSLVIQPGEVHAIVGENGSGKSTLAKVISGVVLPDSGTLSVFGSTPNNPIEARRLGVATIFQEVLVAESLSVTDNVFTGSDTLWRRGRPAAEARKQCQEILWRFTGEDIDPNTLVRHLPLSVRQWIVIARALLSDPRLLILDESSAALDLDATERLHKEIRELKQRGCCVVIVTHRIAELVRITDRATVLRDGAVVGELNGPEITEDNLLGMMSPTRDTSQATSSGPQQEGETKSGRPVLVRSRNVVSVRGSAGINVEVREGEIIGVTGLDGHGHGSFLRVIAGLVPPFSGKVSVDGADGSKEIRTLSDAVENGIAFVSGDRAREGIFPNLSIFENFALPLYRANFGEFGWIDRTPLEQSFVSECRRLSIKTGPWQNRITSLSGGNQQKVLIARALAAQPRLIVLDDPARGVDIGTKRELYAELKSFVATGGAVIYLSSEIEEFFGLADRVLVFRDGSVFREVPATDISEHALLAAMFGRSATAPLQSTPEAAR